MTYNGSSSRYFQIMFVSTICFGLACLLFVHIFVYNKIELFPFILIIVCAFSAAGSSKSIWDVQITETGINGPVRLNKKLICSEFKFEDVIKIKNGIPMLSNYYVQNKNGQKMYLHYPYLSKYQINDILNQLNQKANIELTDKE